MHDFILVRYVFVLSTYNNLLTKAINKSLTSNCPPGYYGSECTEKCPTLCNGTCDVAGRCLHCFQIGYRLPYCDQICENGTFGLDCLKQCSENCLEEKCDAFTGHCRECRDTGVKLPDCTEPCEPGSYGINCAMRCPLSCKDFCDPVNGTCSHCSIGSGEHCTVNCAAESDQELCRLYCPNQCLTLCNTTTSHCALCFPGYTPPFCNTTCQPGRYGNNCDKHCSRRCRGERCDPISGACFSCTDGYVGTKCNGQCIKGYYGQDCDLACPETCINGSCDFVNGSCFRCQDGYQGAQCNELCGPGKYGQNCFMDCPKNCLNSCDPATGVCYRCLPGYKDIHCNVTCEEGTFGDGCREMCPPECVCNPMTGKCNNCLSDPSGPGCETVSLNDDSARTILELCLYVIVSLLGLVLFLSLIMWLYKKHLNTFWRQVSRMVSLNSIREAIDLKREQGETNNDDGPDNFRKEKFISDAAIKEYEETERQRKLVNYLRNHGKTYTPLERDKTLIRIHYMKQTQMHPPETLNGSPERPPQGADARLTASQVNVSISHATVVGSNAVAEDRIRPTQKQNSKQFKTYDITSSVNPSHSFLLKHEDDITSVVARNKMKSTGEQSLNRSQLAPNDVESFIVGKKMNDDKGVLQSSHLLLVSAANKHHVTNMTYTSDTRSKFSDSKKNANNKSLMFNQNEASADSLYGITSQEFGSDGSKSVMARHLGPDDSIPIDSLYTSLVNKVRSEQSISNDGSVADRQKRSKKFSTSTWVFDHLEARKQNSEFVQEKSKETKGSNYLDCEEHCSAVDGKGLLNDVNMMSWENPSPVLSEYSATRGKGPKRIQSSAMKLLDRDAKSDTLESLTESTMSEAEEESVEECSSYTESRTIPLFHSVDAFSDSTQDDGQHNHEGLSSHRLKHKNKISSVRKKYRKVSPPKCLHGDRLASLDAHFNKDKKEDNQRSTYSHIDVHGNARQPLVARLSTSATVKGDSPRLVRCATTRQLSPMYPTRSATTNRLTPLPTPPPEGRMHLRPLGKLSSSSSILEQEEDEPE